MQSTFYRMLTTLRMRIIKFLKGLLPAALQFASLTTFVLFTHIFLVYHHRPLAAHARHGVIHNYSLTVEVDDLALASSCG